MYDNADINCHWTDSVGICQPRRSQQIECSPDGHEDSSFRTLQVDFRVHILMAQRAVASSVIER